MKPGTYYVVVRQLGYRSPIEEFSRTDLEKPTAALAQRIAGAVPMVTVGADQTATVDTRIEHAGVLTGRVIFDDGSPAADVSVLALRRREDGVWDSVQRNMRPIGLPFTQTDDQGRFRIVNLSKGEFLLEAEFHLDESMTTSIFSTMGGSSSTGGVDRLSVYAGNVFRESQATRIKLAAGEERSGEEIVVALSKLHTVSGGLVNRNGGIVNGGVVLLFEGDERRPVAQAAVGMDDGAFHCSFVPEGTYRLEAYGVDVVPTEVPLVQAALTGLSTQGKGVKVYGPARQTLIVQNEITGLVVTAGGDGKDGVSAVVT